MPLSRSDREMGRLWRLTAIGLDRLGRTRPWLSTHGFALALCATVLIAGAVRVYKLDYQSLWSDEIFSLITTDPNLSVSEFWARVRADTHPPIYYLLLRLSSSVFGQSELAARAPSAVFGILTLCAAAMLPGSSLSRGARLALPLLIAASPGAAWYDREARPYALLLLLSTLITLACLRFVSARSNRHAHRSRSFGLIHALFRVSRGRGGLYDLLSADGQATQGDRRFRRLQCPCPVRALGRVSFPVRRYAARGMDRQFSIDREHRLVQLPVVRWDGAPRAVRCCGPNIFCGGRMARTWGLEYSDLRVHSGLRSDIGGGSGGLATYSDPDEPQHDRRPSGSLRDCGGAGFLPGTTLGHICGCHVSCCPDRADEPADSRLLHERNEGGVARYSRARLEHSRL